MNVEVYRWSEAEREFLAKHDIQRTGHSLTGRPVSFQYPKGKRPWWVRSW